MKKIILLTFLAILFCHSSPALAVCSWAGNTGTVANPYDDSDLQDCVRDAVGKTGEVTINIPACSATWESPVSIDMSTGWTNVTQLNIIGAGKTQTHITDVTASGWGNAPFWITSKNGKGIRISGIDFDGTGDYQGTIRVLGDTKTLRIDNCIFEDLNNFSIVIGNSQGTQEVFGVIDHNNFISTGVATGSGMYIAGSGIAAWSVPLSLGSGDAIFIEDNLFDYAEKNDSTIQSGNASRYVFRYNTVYNTTTDAHGPDSSKVGSYSYEIYENAIICDKSHCNDVSAFYLRGGTGVIYNNTLTGSFASDTFQLQYFRSCFNESECTALNTPLYPSWGNCNCYFTDNSSKCDGDAPVDGNQDATGWPCKQQPGTSSIGPDPIYEWGNNLNGADLDIDVHGYFCAAQAEDANDHIQKDRDFFNDTLKSGYTPYVYPHPLRNENPIDTVPPFNPTELLVR